MRDRLHALTSVRFFAALWVVAFHQSASNGWLFGSLMAGPAFFLRFVRTGYVAVGMFFVLSGFILTYTYSKPSLKTRAFLSARFARIYPVYALGLLLALPSVVFPWRHHHLPPVETILGTLALPALLLQSWHPHYALVFNTPGWSLSAEMFFYLMFPLLIPLIRGKSKSWLMGGLGAVIGLSLIVPLACTYLNVQGFGRAAASDPVGDQTIANIVQFNPLLRLPDFIFGMIVARLFLARSTLPNQKADGWKWYVPGILGMLVMCSWLSQFIPHPMFNSVLLILFGMMIYGLACGGGIIERALSLPWLVKLGEASYAMYIVHAPLVWWTYWLDGKGPNMIPTHPAVVFMIYLIATVTFSLVVYACVEEPARQYLRLKFSQKSSVPISPLQPEPVLI